MKLTQEITILLTKDWETLNKRPTWRSKKPCLNRHITRKKHSFGFKVPDLPCPKPSSVGSFQNVQVQPQETLSALFPGFKFVYVARKAL